MSTINDFANNKELFVKIDKLRSKRRILPTKKCKQIIDLVTYEGRLAVRTRSQDNPKKSWQLAFGYISNKRPPKDDSFLVLGEKEYFIFHSESGPARILDYCFNYMVHGKLKSIKQFKETYLKKHQIREAMNGNFSLS